MAFKDYTTDYPEPRIPNGHFPVDPKETFEIEYIHEGILARNRAVLSASADINQIFRKKDKGTRCTNPVCPASQTIPGAPLPDCPVCFGTGFVGGYDYLGEIYITFPQTLERIEWGSDGTMRKVTPRIWTMPDPVLRTFDIVLNFSQPQVTQEQVYTDKELVSGAGTNPDFDVIDNDVTTERQIIRVVKIADFATKEAAYIEGVDYVLSNDGVLWKTDNRPVPGDTMYVTYSVSATYYRRYEIKSVSPSRWRGKTLHQNLEVDELNLSHPAYKISQESITAALQQTIYNPFPVSEWFDRP